MLSSVVLPEPEGPSIATNSLSRNDTDTLSSAVCVKSAVVYDLHMRLSWSMRVLCLSLARSLDYQASPGRFLAVNSRHCLAKQALAARFLHRKPECGTAAASSPTQSAMLRWPNARSASNPLASSEEKAFRLLLVTTALRRGGKTSQWLACSSWLWIMEFDLRSGRRPRAAGTKGTSIWNATWHGRSTTRPTSRRSNSWLPSTSISSQTTRRSAHAAAAVVAHGRGARLPPARRGGPRWARHSRPGDKVWARRPRQGAHARCSMRDRSRSRSGLNILGAHIDSPRLDLKQDPLAGEATSLAHARHALLRRHQEVPVGHACRSPPHGVVVTDGRHRRPRRDRGEDEDDPVVLRDRPAPPPRVASRWARRPREVIDGRGCSTSSMRQPPASCADEAAADEGRGRRERARSRRACSSHPGARPYGIDGGGPALSAELEVVPAGRCPRPGPRPLAWSSATARTTASCAYTSARGAARRSTSAARRTAVRPARRQGGDRQRWAPRAWRRQFFENTMAEMHGAGRRGRPARCCAAALAAFEHAVVRRIRGLRPRVRERVRAEEQRVSGPWPRVQQVHGLAAARAGPTTRPPSTSRASAASWTMPAVYVPNRRARPASTRAAAGLSPIFPRSTA